MTDHCQANIHDGGQPLRDQGATPSGQVGDRLAQHQRVAFEKALTFYTDQAPTQPVFGFNARLP
jgi:hypothetical protein